MQRVSSGAGAMHLLHDFLSPSHLTISLVIVIFVPCYICFTRIEYNELEQKCETHIDFLTDRKDNESTVCCEKKVSFNSLPIDWKYACGSQSCNEDADSGTVSFDVAALTTGTSYEAHLLSKTGFAIKAKTEPFVVVGNGL